MLSPIVERDILYRLFIAIVLSGCGAAPHPLAEHPEARFLRAEGLAEGSAAAEAAARAEVSKQIHSSLRAELETLVGQHGDSATTHAERRVVESTYFAHAELIHVVEVRCEEKQCRAWAALDRGEAVKVLARHYEEASPRFREAALAALASGACSKTTAATTAELPRCAPAEFTSHFRAARKAWSVLSPLAWQMRVIGRRPRPEVLHDRMQLGALMDARARILAGVGVQVLPTTGDPDAALGKELRAAAVGAISGLGIKAAIAEQCTGRLALVARTHLACGRGSFGPRCELQAVGHLQSCAGQELARFAMPGLAGAHPKDEAEAMQALRARITPDQLSAPLGEALARVLPLDEQP